MNDIFSKITYQFILLFVSSVFYHSWKSIYIYAWNISRCTFSKKSPKKNKCRGNLAMKRVRIQTHSKSTNIIFKYHTNKLTQGLMTTSTQLTPDDSKSLYRKWLFHQTSIYKWLFGVPGRYMSSQYVHVWFVCLQLRDKIKDIPSGIQSMAAKVTSKVHPWLPRLQGYTLED